MSTTPVTVCVLTRGRLALLRESLGGILAQDHAALDIVVSDNWSDDGTREHVLDLAGRDPRVRYVRPPAPTGIYGNHNFALSQASGRYVCFFHDDDLYEPTIVSRYATFLDEHASVGAVCADWERVDLAGRRIGRRRRRTPAVIPGLSYIDATMVSGVSALALSGSMFRRDALGQRPPFDEDGPIGFTDMVTFFRIAETYDIGTMRETLWSYRTHPGAFSNKPAERIADDHARAFGAYCDEFLRRHPGEYARVERWRAAIARYRFWLLLYGATVQAAGGSDRPLADPSLARAARGPLARLSLAGVRLIARTRWRWPLGVLGRYAVSGRWLIGLR